MLDRRFPVGQDRPVPMRRVAIALLLLALVPSDALAWTPGTHILLGETVLRNAALLPAALAALIREYPWDFLYGNIAADTSIAKKYARFGRHCHSWTVGLDRKSTRLNSSHSQQSRMPSSA